MCVKCNSSGWVVAEHRTKKSIFAFLCDCGRESKLYQGIRKWNDSNKIEFIPDFDRPKIITAPKTKNDDDDCPF